MFGYQLANVQGGGYQFLDPSTNLIYSFTSSGAPTKIEDRNGNALTIQAPANGTAQVTDGLGRSITFSLDASGNITKVQDQTGRSVLFAYTGTDLTQVTDANGKVDKYSYTTATNMVGLMTSLTLPVGNAPFTQVWNTSGQVSKQSDSRGNSTSFIYDPAGVGPTTVTDPLGVAEQHVGAKFTHEVSYTDPYSNTIGMGYDASGHRNSLTDRLGDKTSLTFHSPSGYLATYTDALGNSTNYTYTPQTQGAFTFYVLTEIQFADGTSISITYDNLGNPATVTDAAGKVTKYTYNNHGQPLTITNPANGVATTTYNLDGTPAAVTDPNGNTVTYSYDDKKRPVQFKYADGSTFSVVYDNRDNILKVTDERGKVLTAAYNDNNKLQSLTDSLGKTASWRYDTDERVQAAVDFAGKTSSSTYNELGLLQKQTAPAGDFFSLVYDKTHNPVSFLDAAGKGLSAAYDKEHVPASVTDALSRTWIFTTDKLGHRTRTKTPLGENYDTTFDNLGRVVSKTDPLAETTTYTYDPRGLLASVTRPLASSSSGSSSDALPRAATTAQIKASYARNDLGLVTSITDPNGNVWAQNFDSTARLISRTDPLSRTTKYGYDNRNRVSGSQSPVGTVAYTYDAAGNLLRQLYSDGTDLNYTFDDDNRLLTGPGLTLSYDANGEVTASNGIVATRDDDRRIASITYANGKTVAYTYDARGLLVAVKDWVGGSTTLAYNDAHQLVSITRPNGTTTQCSYDHDGNLSGIVESVGASIALQRDGARQITSADRNLPQAPAPAPGTLPLGFDAAGQISAATYDGMGRLTNDSLRAYSWDLASRLTAYNGSDGSATASYDGLGLRISSANGGSTQKYVLNYALDLPSVATVQDGSGNDQRYYIHLPTGKLLYSIEAAGNARHFFHFDEMGSTTLLTDDAGTVTDSYGITPYGETVTAGPSNATVNPFTWLGAYGVMQEGSTSLYYMRARWYDSAPARFLSPDAVHSLDARRIDRYQYALQNPLRSIDPQGRQDVANVGSSDSPPGPGLMPSGVGVTFTDKPPEGCKDISGGFGIYEDPGGCPPSPSPELPGLSAVWPYIMGPTPPMILAPDAPVPILIGPALSERAANNYETPDTSLVKLQYGTYSKAYLENWRRTANRDETDEEKARKLAGIRHDRQDVLGYLANAAIGALVILAILL